jgi:site-specific DNA recombinase
MVNEFRELKKEKDNFTIDLKKYKEQLETSQVEELNAEKILEFTHEIKGFIAQGGHQLSLKEKRFIVDMLIDEILIRYIDQDVVLTILGHLGVLYNGEGQKEVVLQKRFKLINSAYKNTKVIVPMEN